MATGLCERQASALNAVVDRADFLEHMAMSNATTLECCTIAPKVKNQREAPREYCHFFRRGQCKFGDKCKKSHEEQEDKWSNKCSTRKPYERSGNSTSKKWSGNAYAGMTLEEVL